MNRVWSLRSAVGLVLVCCVIVNAETQQGNSRTGKSAGSDTFGRAQPLSLAAAQQQETQQTQAETIVAKQTETAIEGMGDIWEPVKLRSADPEKTGELEIKNIYHHGTTSGERDANTYELELEYGIAPNHEIILAVPDVSLNALKTEDNGNLELGWHWRLWKEAEVLPAFALRNILIIPSGYDSSGVEWTFRGLFTKTIIPCKWRVHLNPYFTLDNGNEEDLRHFQWGFFAGTDYQLTDKLHLVFDYIHRSSESTGERNQHELEAALGWKINEHNEIAFATNCTLDGDSVGENWGFTVSYVITLDNLPAICKTGN